MEEIKLYVDMIENFKQYFYLGKYHRLIDVCDGKRLQLLNIEINQLKFYRYNIGIKKFSLL